MEHGDGTVELRLDRWVAGNRKIHFAEFSRVACGMLMLGKSWCDECRADGEISTMEIKVNRFMLASLETEGPSDSRKPLRRILRRRRTEVK